MIAARPKPGVESWCCGLSLSGERQLTADEIETANLSLRRASRRHAIEKWLTRAVMWVPALAFAMAEQPKEWTARDVPLWLVLTVSIAVFAAGGLSALLEVIVPRNETMALLFRVGAAAAVAGIISRWLGVDEKSANGIAIAVLFGMALGGVIAWYGRWNERRVMTPLIPLAQDDLRQGVVLCFGGTAEVAGQHLPALAYDFKRESERGKLGIEVLPASALLFRLGARRYFPWTVVPVVHLGTPVSDTNLTDEGEEGAQRSLSRAECDELLSHAKKQARKALGGFFLTTWIAAMALRAIENVVQSQLRPELSPIGWAAALAIGAGVALYLLRLRARLQRDATAAVVRVEHHPSDAVGRREVRIELLPESKLEWTRDRKAAEWRKRGD